MTSPVPTIDQVTLAVLRANARQRCGMENSTFVTDAEMNTYVNRGLQALHEFRANTFEEYDVVSLESSAAMTGPIDMGNIYASMRPAAFVPTHTSTRVFKLRGIDYQLGADDWATLQQFNFRERNRVNRAVTNGLRGDGRRYRIMGNAILIYPETAPAAIYRVWFVPTLVPLTDDAGEVADGLQGWTEYAEAYASMLALKKEESDFSADVMTMQAIEQRIIASSPRDIGEPETIANVQDYESGAWWAR